VISGIESCIEVQDKKRYFAIVDGVNKVIVNRQKGCLGQVEGSVG